MTLSIQLKRRVRYAVTYHFAVILINISNLTLLNAQYVGELWHIQMQEKRRTDSPS